MLYWGSHFTGEQIKSLSVDVSHLKARAEWGRGRVQLMLLLLRYIWKTPNAFQRIWPAGGIIEYRVKN